ncbi:hypothetical protein JAK48_12150 [Stenotrophomonas maltophilia]|nr:hypothetical protein [Stenotrophomonas pavanii]MCU1047308.1 hypothetical protein [Stenotrophomonas maltophilia]
MLPRLLFFLLWIASTASAQTPVPTPEQSFDLFARFMLEGDTDAEAQIAAKAVDDAVDTKAASVRFREP